MEAAEKQLRRLIAMDAALASPDGLRLAEFATEHAIDAKTARRLMSSIRACGLEIATKRIDEPGGHYSINRYVGRFRMFTMHVHRQVSDI
jgi:predicted DNA-binding transcriptional regulator YafY